jgi:hypothetical protein
MVRRRQIQRPAQRLMRPVMQSGSPGPRRSARQPRSTARDQARQPDGWRAACGCELFSARRSFDGVSPGAGYWSRATRGPSHGS